MMEGAKVIIAPTTKVPTRSSFQDALSVHTINNDNINIKNGARAVAENIPVEKTVPSTYSSQNGRGAVVNDADSLATYTKQNGAAALTDYQYGGQTAKTNNLVADSNLSPTNQNTRTALGQISEGLMKNGKDKTVSIKVPANVPLSTVLKNIYEHMYQTYFNTRPNQNGGSASEAQAKKLINGLVEKDMHNLPSIVLNGGNNVYQQASRNTTKQTEDEKKSKEFLEKMYQRQVKVAQDLNQKHLQAAHARNQFAVRNQQLEVIPKLPKENSVPLIEQTVTDFQEQTPLATPVSSIKTQGFVSNAVQQPFREQPAGSANVVNVDLKVPPVYVSSVLPPNSVTLDLSDMEKILKNVHIPENMQLIQQQQQQQQQQQMEHFSGGTTEKLDSRMGNTVLNTGLRKSLPATGKTIFNTNKAQIKTLGKTEHTVISDRTRPVLTVNADRKSILPHKKSQLPDHEPIDIDLQRLNDFKTEHRKTEYNALAKMMLPIPLSQIKQEHDREEKQKTKQQNVVKKSETSGPSILNSEETMSLENTKKDDIVLRKKSGPEQMLYSDSSNPVAVQQSLQNDQPGPQAFNNLYGQYQDEYSRYSDDNSQQFPFNLQTQLSSTYGTRGDISERGYTPNTLRTIPPLTNEVNLNPVQKSSVYPRYQEYAQSTKDQRNPSIDSRYNRQEVPQTHAETRNKIFTKSPSILNFEKEQMPIFRENNTTQIKSIGHNNDSPSIYDLQNRYKNYEDSRSSRQKVAQILYGFKITSPSLFETDPFENTKRSAIAKVKQKLSLLRKRQIADENKKGSAKTKRSIKATLKQTDGRKSKISVTSQSTITVTKSGEKRKPNQNSIHTKKRHVNIMEIEKNENLKNTRKSLKRYKVAISQNNDTASTSSKGYNNVTRSLLAATERSKTKMASTSENLMKRSRIPNPAAASTNPKKSTKRHFKKQKNSSKLSKSKRVLAKKKATSAKDENSKVAWSLNSTFVQDLNAEFATENKQMKQVIAMVRSPTHTKHFELKKSENTAFTTTTTAVKTVVPVTANETRNSRKSEISRRSKQPKLNGKSKKRKTIEHEHESLTQGIMKNALNLTFSQPTDAASNSTTSIDRLLRNHTIMSEPSPDGNATATTEAYAISPLKEETGASRSNIGGDLETMDVGATNAVNVPVFNDDAMGAKTRAGDLGADDVEESLMKSMEVASQDDDSLKRRRRKKKSEVARVTPQHISKMDENAKSSIPKIKTVLTTMKTAANFIKTELRAK